MRDRWPANDEVNQVIALVHLYISCISTDDMAVPRNIPCRRFALYFFSLSDQRENIKIFFNSKV